MFLALVLIFFDIDQKIKNLVGDEISQPEKKILKKAFLKQTVALLSDQHQGSIDQGLSNINLLAEKQQAHANSGNSMDIDQLYSIFAPTFSQS